MGTDSDISNSTNYDNNLMINNDINRNISENTQTGKEKIIHPMNCRALRIQIINTMIFQTSLPG